MASITDAAARYKRVVARLPQENISNASVIKESLADPNKAAKCIWVTSPTGRPHLGYLVPLLKLGEFVEAGVKVQIVLLDTYSYLDNVDYPVEQVLHRMEFYRHSVTAALQCLGIDSSDIEFVQESTYETPKFTKDLWRLCTMVPAQMVKDSWDRSVHPEMVSPLMCPLLQLLAEEYLDADFQFGGEDQGSIFDLIEHFAPKMGHRPRGHMMNPMLPNLTGMKMSASHAESTKVMLLDPAEEIERKLQDAPWQTEANKNAFLMALRDILIPLSEYHSRPTARVLSQWQNPSVAAEAPTATCFTATAGGSQLHFQSYNEIREAIVDGRLSTDDLKQSVAEAVKKLLAPARAVAASDADWQAAEAGAYPS